MTNLINILIRTSQRPALFARCLASINAQTYSNYRIIVAYDRADALAYIPKDLTTIFVYADNSLPFYYDRYCNNLKTLVTEGWFVFLDDDDVLTRPTILEELSRHLTEPGAIICQFLRNGLPKPRTPYIRRGIIEEGKIGLPCLVLHSNYKNLSELDGYKSGDYRYIKAVTDQVPTKFIELPLVTCDRRSLGEMEFTETSGFIENK
jgi:glycosyltransferase involved in cell wall biosynthesis